MLTTVGWNVGFRRHSLLGVFGLLSLALSAQANIVVNPGFESGAFAPGWTTSGNDAAFVAVDNFAPHSGTFAAYFGPQGSPAFLTQTINTIPGTLYDLAFFSQNEASGVNAFSVSWNGVALVTLQDSAAFPYTQFTFTGLLATAATTDLQFSFVNQDGFWDLDDVTVDEGLLAGVPEPATLGLASLAMLAFAVLRKRA